MEASESCFAGDNAPFLSQSIFFVKWSLSINHDGLELASVCRWCCSMIKRYSIPVHVMDDSRRPHAHCFAPCVCVLWCRCWMGNFEHKSEWKLVVHVCTCCLRFSGIFELLSGIWCFCITSTGWFGGRLSSSAAAEKHQLFTMEEVQPSEILNCCLIQEDHCEDDVAGLGAGASHLFHVRGCLWRATL
ncbi:hypothetical protein Nepgr_033838 [Nepenthes gracilis]|uniref:Uncharacterized protein n=1 Tax=Nepenthes gracilis TaxID=150966 RepID=A0AAD3Y8Z2_NEPGR|nr:hypothetical protein Nepgr_033838 [Nepenthes gracilis]